MRTAHAGLHITDADFDRVLGHLNAALVDAGVVTDRILRPRADPGASAPSSQLKFGSGRAPPCPAPPVTMPTNPSPRKRNGRHIADQAVTVSTKASIPVCTVDDVFNRRFNDGQQSLAKCSGRFIP
jgi:hypothetical protein